MASDQRVEIWKFIVKTSVSSVVEHSLWSAIGRTQIGPFGAEISWTGPMITVIFNWAYKKSGLDRCWWRMLKCRWQIDYPWSSKRFWQCQIVIMSNNGHQHKVIIIKIKLQWSWRKNYVNDFMMIIDDNLKMLVIEWLWEDFLFMLFSNQSLISQSCHLNKPSPTSIGWD